jgi:hypothetical protein
MGYLSLGNRGLFSWKIAILLTKDPFSLDDVIWGNILLVVSVDVWGRLVVVRVGVLFVCSGNAEGKLA